MQISRTLMRSYMLLRPNLITLVGLGFVLVNVILIAYLMPNLDGPTYPWVYFSCAAGVWLYSTFDNVDGKQARRTNSSSPLGELFDHGCDALNCSLGGIVQAAAMGLGQSWMSIYVPFMAIVAFYFSTWEEYYTGVLYLGYVNGPTEGLVLACTIMILSGLYGPHIWMLPARSVLPVTLGSLIPEDWTLTYAIAVQMTLLLVFLHIPFSLYNVYKVCRRKKISFAGALVGILPLMVWGVSGYLWLAAPSSRIVQQHCMLFIAAMGIVFGRMATKIILAYVTRSKFPFFTVMFLPLIGGTVAANAPEWFGMQVFKTSEMETYYLWGFFTFVLGAYLNWAFIVIDRFCKHLKIKCLTIPYSPTKKTK